MRGTKAVISTLRSLSAADTRASQDIFPHKDAVSRQLNLRLIGFSSFHMEEKDFNSLQRHTKISDKLELKINEEGADELAQWVQLLPTRPAS